MTLFSLWGVGPTGRGGKGTFKETSETLEKPASERLMENVHMQGFRNPEE
jgi:hypothetical protein